MSNKDVYREIHKKRSIQTTIGEKRTKWIGHLLKNNAWVTFKVEVKIEGKPGRGRSRHSCMKQIILDLDKVSYKELKKVAMDKEE